MFIFNNGNIINPETEQVINEDNIFISASQIAFNSIDDIVENVINKIALYIQAENQKLASKYSAEFGIKKEELQRIETELNNAPSISDENMDKISQIKQRLKLASYETSIKKLTIEIEELQKKEEEELREKTLELKDKLEKYRNSLLSLVESSETLIENNLKGEKQDYLKTAGIPVSNVAHMSLRSLASISVELSLEKNYDKKIKILTEDKYAFSRSFDAVKNKVSSVEGQWLEIKNYSNIYMDEYSIFSKLTDSIIEVLMERKEHADVTRRKNEEDALYVEREESKRRLVEIDQMLNELIRETIKIKLDEKEIKISEFLAGSKFFK